MIYIKIPLTFPKKKKNNNAGITLWPKVFSKYFSLLGGRTVTFTIKSTLRKYAYQMEIVRIWFFAVSGMRNQEVLPHANWQML